VISQLLSELALIDSR